VGKKLFAIYSAEGRDEWMNLKCFPEWSEALRKQHPEIVPGWHMNKKHWNTVKLPRPLVKKLVDCSYDLVSGRVKAWAGNEGRVIKAKTR
jgi:predicted DNA-binding protein (MmcQ/YjbR family)